MSRRTFALSVYARHRALYHAVLLLLSAGYIVSRVVRGTWSEGWLVVVLILGGLAARTIWLNLMTEPFAVTVAEEGIGVADRVMGWGEIDGLRVVHGGIEVLRGGERAGFVSYEMHDFAEVVTVLAQKVRRHDVSMPTRLTAPRAWLDRIVRPIAVVVCTAFGLWTYANGMTFLAAVSGIAAGGMLYTLARLPILGIDFDPEAIRVRRLTGTRVYRRSEVHGFAVIPRQWHVYTVAFAGEGRRQVRLELKGVDPFYILEAGRRAYPETAA